MFKPQRAELLELGFYPRVEKVSNKVKWIKELKPINRDCRFIVYREEHNSFGYGRLRFNIGNIEELQILIKIHSKKKATK